MPEVRAMWSGTAALCTATPCAQQQGLRQYCDWHSVRGHWALALQRLGQFKSGQSGGTEAVTVDMEAMVAPCMVDMEAPCMVAWGQCMGRALSTEVL